MTTTQDPNNEEFQKNFVQKLIKVRQRFNVGNDLSSSSSLFLEEAQRKYMLDCFDTNRALNKLRIKDSKWIVDNRALYANGLLLFLGVQYILIIWLVCWATQWKMLKDTSTLLAILIPGIFAETVFLVKIFIEWLFKPVDFSHVHGKNRKDTDENI